MPIASELIGRSAGWLPVVRQYLALGAFEDEAGLDVGHLGAGGEGIQGQVAQVMGVPHGHVDLEVVRARHVEDRQHFGQPQHVFPEGLHLGAAVLAQLHGDEGLKPDPQGLGIHLGMSAFQHPLAPQALHPGQTGRGRQAHGGGQFLVGEPSILLKKLNQGEVDSVQFHDFHYFTK